MPGAPGVPPRLSAIAEGPIREAAGRSNEHPDYGPIS